MDLYKPLWHPLIRRFFFGVYHFFGGYEVIGAENVPRHGPVIVASNHLSVADPVGLYAACPRLLHYMAARELHQARILGPVIRFLRAFPVSRGEIDPEAMAIARALLQAGEAVAIFAEGGCSPDGRLQPLFPGTAALALRVGCPVVPAVIQGTDRMYPFGATFPRFAPTSLRFGPPLEFGKVKPGIPVRVQVEEAMAALRQALLALGAPGLPGEGATGPDQVDGDGGRVGREHGGDAALRRNQV